MKKLISLIVFFYTSFSFAGEVFYVKVDGNDSNDGKTWETAFADVQTAIDTAHAVASDENPSEVRIAAGKYGTSKEFFTLKNNVSIYGGFNTDGTREGETIFLVQIRNDYTEESKLDKNVVIDSIIFEDASYRRSGWNYEKFPGCIYNKFSKLKIQNCTFRNCNLYAPNNNGENGMTLAIVTNIDSAVEILNCNFDKNCYNEDVSRTKLFGFLVYGDKNSHIKLKNCNIKNTRYLRAVGVSINSNSCLYLINGNIDVVNSHFENNVANLILYGNITIDNSSFFQNYASIAYSSNGISIKASTFAENDENAYHFGNGLITAQNSDCFVENTTFYYNRLATNHSILNISIADQFIVAYSTFAKNVGSGSRANINIFRVKNAQILNSIVDPYKYETAIYIDTIDPGTVKLKNSYLNNIPTGDNIITENLIDIPPSLGKLDSNGGNVKTLPLLNGSSGIGAGAINSDLSAYDARGYSRSKVAPSIGAFEYIEPIIKKQPESTGFFCGKSCKLSILANGLEGTKYQWQKLTDSEKWENIDNATASELLFTNCEIELNETKYRCIVSNFVDNVSVISDEVSLFLNDNASTSTLITNRITTTNKGYAHFEVASDAIEPSYRWYYSSDNGKTWNEILGETNFYLDFQVDSTMNRRQFKCEVTDGGGTSVMSNAGVLIINDKSIVIDNDVSDKIGFIGKSIDFTVGATSTTELSYQWQMSVDGGNSWVDIDEATSEKFSIIPENYELDGNLYRCKINNGGGYIYSSSAKLTIFKNPEILSQPTDFIAWDNKSAFFTIMAKGDGTLRYQWQESKDGEIWNNLDGMVSPTLTLNPVSIDMNGNRYRCIASNEGAETISNVATLTVYKTLEITAQPQDIYVFEGDSGTFTVNLDAQGDVAYQWQQNINGIWFDIENETSESLTISDMTESKDGIQYRVIIKNGGDTFESAPATLHFAYPISITKQPNIIPVAYIGKTVTFSVETTGYVEKYQWFVSTNYGTDTPIEIPNANANTLTLHVNDDTILESVYYCVIKNAKTNLETDWVYIEEVREPTKFILWADENDLSGDNANALATPFNDGISNIEKFAFGLSGNKSATYAENALFKQSYADGKACFQFPISKDAADSVNVKVMTSEDLVNWVEAQSSNIGESGDFNLMQTEQTVPEGGKLFFKLIVEEK